jgi:hypothetical protein
MNMELMTPVTDKMLLENLVDEKNREIARLKKELESRPAPMSKDQVGRHLIQCQNIDEVVDLLMKLGLVKKFE